MSAVATINMGLTYNQVLGLTMQLDEASRLKLYQALGKELRTASSGVDLMNRVSIDETWTAEEEKASALFTSQVNAARLIAKHI